MSARRGDVTAAFACRRTRCLRADETRGQREHGRNGAVCGVGRWRGHESAPVVIRELVQLALERPVREASHVPTHEPEERDASRRDEPAVASPARESETSTPLLGSAQLLALQRSAGNQAVTRALQRKPLYRGMQAETPNAARPLLGNDSGFQLGVRDGEFQMGKDGKVIPGSGGMSTANVRNKVPDFTASKAYAFGGHNSNDQSKQAFRWVWEFDDGGLPKGIQARNDHDAQGMIEAAEAMTPDDLRAKVQGTQGGWARSDPP